MLKTIIITYLLLINLAGLILMKVDKQKAIHHKWRIPEATLFGVAILGGSIGSILGMQLFRHKTKHNSFKFGMPAILILQLLIAGGIFYACSNLR